MIEIGDSMMIIDWVGELVSQEKYDKLSVVNCDWHGCTVIFIPVKKEN